MCGSEWAPPPLGPVVVLLCSTARSITLRANWPADKKRQLVRLAANLLRLLLIADVNLYEDDQSTSCPAGVQLVDGHLIGLDAANATSRRPAKGWPAHLSRARASLRSVGGS